MIPSCPVRAPQARCSWGGVFFGGEAAASLRWAHEAAPAVFRYEHAYSVRVKSELLLLLFSRFWAFFENDYKEKRELLFIVTPSLLRIRTRGLEPPRLSSLEPETSASTNSATCAFDWCRGSLPQIFFNCKPNLQKNDFFLFFAEPAPARK